MALSPASEAVPRMRTRRIPLSGSGMMSAAAWSSAAQVPAGSLVFALCLCDGGHHAGFGPVGDHSDDVEEEFFAFGQCIQEVLFVEVGDGDMFRGVAALELDGVAPGVERVALGLELPGGFGGGGGRRVPGQIGDLVAQGAEALPKALDAAVEWRASAG